MKTTKVFLKLILDLDLAQKQMEANHRHCHRHLFQCLSLSAVVERR
jgi:hypothetical protein